jgi:hypothetical protein
MHMVETRLALLTHSSVPLRFLGDAFITTCFLINRLPSKVIGFNSPIQRLTGVKLISL